VQGAFEPITDEKQVGDLLPIRESIEKQMEETTIMVFWRNTWIGRRFIEIEAAHAEVVMVMAQKDPGRFLVPQPHLHPSDAPLRNSYLFFADGAIQGSSWEDWSQQSVAQRRRLLPVQSDIETRGTLILFYL